MPLLSSCPSPLEGEVGRGGASHLGLAVLLLLAASPVQAAAPEVVVSIKPLHSLVAGVMAGVAEPQLLVPGAASPHAYALRPSDARRLEGARLVFWVGPVLESFLVKPLAALAHRAEIVEADRLPEVTLLAARGGGAWEQDADHDHDRDPADGAAARADGHLWLDPANARAIVRAAAARLAALDPANAARYGENGRALEARLMALDEELAARLHPVRGLPFVVFHDAYHYLEARYGLVAIGSITVSPDRPPGARRVERIREKIVATQARCVFSEPQFSPALAETLTEGAGARTAVLDPEGAALAPGPELYPTLMRRLAESLVGCLGAAAAPRDR